MNSNENLAGIWKTNGCRCAWCLELIKSQASESPVQIQSATMSHSKPRPPPPTTPKPRQSTSISKGKPPPPKNPKPTPPKKYVEPWQCKNCEYANNVKVICQTTGCGTKRPQRYVIGKDPTGLYEEEDEAFLAMKKAEEQLTEWLKSEKDSFGTKEDAKSLDILSPLMGDNGVSGANSNSTASGDKAPHRRRPSSAVKMETQNNIVHQLQQQVEQLQQDNRTLQETLSDQTSSESETNILVTQLQQQVVHLQNENKELQERLISQAKDASEKLVVLEGAFVNQSKDLQRREKDVHFLRQQLKLLLGSKPLFA